MPSNYSPGRIAGLLLETEVLINLGNSIPQACERIGISESDYLAWRKAYAHLKMDDTIVKYSETKEEAEHVIKITEQQVRSKIYQQILVCFLKDNKTISRDLIDKVTSFYEEAEKIQQILLDSIHPEKQDSIPIACTKGCSYCCGLKVVATEPEFYIIRDYLIDRFPKAKIDQIVAGLQRFLSQMETCNTRSEKLAVKCSFLDDGACGIYQVRPFACRAWNSIDVEVCKRYLISTEEEIPASICHYAPYDVVKKGITQGLYVTGYDPPSEELNAGMLRFLTT